MPKHRKIGAHLSTAGGTYKAIERANAIGANCVQVFSGSPRVWKRPDLDSIDTPKLFSEQRKYNVKPIFTHALYLINLASDKAELRKKSSQVLEFDLHFDALVKGSGVVVHLGSHQGRGWLAVRDQVAQLIATILKNTPSESTFLIENSAGQKGKIGGDLEEIKWLLDQVDSKRLGWCFDTCHGHAAGYVLGKVANSKNKAVTTDTARPPGDKTSKAGHQLPKSALKEISRLKLWSDLKLIHVNDSRDEFGSGRDRHANLGDGKIPPQDLKEFLNHKKVRNYPLILEVPGIDNKGPDAINIERLKKIVA